MTARRLDESSSLVGLSAAGENAWSEFRRQVEWAEDFALIFLFSASRGPVEIFRERLDDLLRTRVSRLWQLPPLEPADCVDSVMELVHQPPQELPVLKATLWLDLSGRGEMWDEARNALLTRLNEHRELLRRQLHQPVVLIFPGGWRAQVRDLAPDLWAVRAYSLDLDETGSVQLQGTSELSNDSKDTLPSHLPAEQLRAAVAQLREWQRLRETAVIDRNLLITGWRAFDAAMVLKNVHFSEQIAKETLDIAHKLRVHLGDLPQPLRDIAVSLDKVGQASRDLGQLEEARDAFRESLGLRRQLRTRLGDLPEILRDISVSLDNVGQVSRDLGQLEEARDTFRESLGLRHQLRTQLGDLPEILRDISVSLDNVGQVSRDLGQLEEARDTFRESLGLRRQLRTKVGDTPQTLRDLSIALDNVGTVARDLGRLEEARAAFAECVIIRQRLATTFPGNEDFRNLLNAAQKRLDEVALTPSSTTQ